MTMGMGSTHNLVFAVNGERFELSHIDPSTTLLEFLRCNTRFKSVKLGCGEGGCGACVVLLSKYDHVLDRVEDFTISACLTLVCSINRCSITTAEGIGNSKDGFHPIQQRFSGFHASQCGYCTPGMCVSVFSALVNADKKNDRPEPSPGFSKLSVSEAENAISGNLCRCTGYRPIADACKSFAANVDMEDLGFNAYWNKGDCKEVQVSRLPFYNGNDKICTFPDFLKREKKLGTMLFNSDKCSWYNPTSIEELHRLLEVDGINHHLRIKLVVGNTGDGYYKETERFDKYIDLRNIPDLSTIKRDGTGVEIGSIMTITKAIEALKEESNGEFHSEVDMVLKKTASHMEKIASGFIRNSASVGGNLVMAQRKHFPSDIATILVALGTMVDIITSLKREKITLEEFLERPTFSSTDILLSVKIPSFRSSNKILFDTYRAAPRPHGNALPYLNAAFFAEISVCNDASKENIVKNCRLVFGAYGTKHARRATKVEEYLSGKNFNVSVLYEAIKLVKGTVIPEYGTSNPAYRTSLAISFLFEFFSPVVDASVENFDILLKQLSNGSKIEYQFDHIKNPALLISGKQVVQLDEEYRPVGEPITKTGAAIQASGEAVYVDDIPSPPYCLYGAFIYSTKPLARVNDIKLNPKTLLDGVTAVITYKDIPNAGENIGSSTLFGNGSLFADDLTRCAGQRIAVVVADTQKHADMAAKFAVVDYNMENIEAPILSVHEAVKRSSFFDVLPFLYPAQIGDFPNGMAEADHKILSAEIKLGSQYYFYMETQTALAVPDEDDCMVVYTSTQCPEMTHTVIAKCIGIPEHSVRVITRRVGGGFGGKAIRAIPVATACALAAYKLRRPVRMYLNRKTDMIMAGGRHPMEITYSVGFKSDGKITALRVDILINAGISADISPIMPDNMIGALKKYDWGALSFDIKVCKTNHTSKSAMRGPGEVQATFIAEAIIEHVALTLSMEVDLVRDKNLHTFNSLQKFYAHSAGESIEYTLPSIMDKLSKSSSFEKRSQMMETFNKCNKWRKRGISRVPIIYKVSLRATPGKVSILRDGSIVVEVGGIELGQGLWTKVKQMAAYALSSVQCDGSENLLKNVRVIQTDTLSLTQGGFTAGSTTSEASCEAVRICCNILLERLVPLKEKLQEQMGSIKWDVLIFQAYLQSINLSASSYYVPDFSSMQYLNYGAAVSEVEVNILTGETTIIQTDIIYDSGQSLNPAVDLGQIEGAFVQGIGFFMSEEYLTNSDGLVTTTGTWTYKIPTIDTIPKQFNVEILNSGHHKNRVLSSKASGEPPLLLAVSVHCATRAAIKKAREQLHSWKSPDVCASSFQLDVPATMPVVKELCGLDNVEMYLQSLLA